MRFHTITQAVIILFFTATAALTEATSGQISVSGEGVVFAAPDVATITLGVNTQAPTAGDALGVNNRDTGAVLALLNDLGIAAKDMQTSNLSLNPLWDHRSNSQKPKITGYQVSNMVTIVVRDLPNLGVVLDRVVSAGANGFHGLQFGISDSDAMRDQARLAAVADARAKAELYAGAAGVKIGRLMSLSESGGRMPQPMMRMEAMAADGVPVAGGEVGINITVNLVYEIVE